MKNLKKFVALLLAGVMAMVLLTACSGGGNTVMDETKQEQAYATIRGNKVNSASVIENDRELQAIADGYLKKDLNGKVEFGGAKWVAGFYVDGSEKNQYLTITATSRYEAGFLLQYLLTEMQSRIGKKLPDTNVDLNAKGSWTKLGVVVRTDLDTKKSYMAISFRIENPNYKGNK